MYTLRCTLYTVHSTYVGLYTGYMERRNHASGGGGGAGSVSPPSIPSPPPPIDISTLGRRLPMPPPPLVNSYPAGQPSAYLHDHPLGPSASSSSRPSANEMSSELTRSELDRKVFFSMTKYLHNRPALTHIPYEPLSVTLVHCVYCFFLSFNVCLVLFDMLGI